MCVSEILDEQLRETGPADHHKTQVSGNARVASLPRKPASTENTGAVLSAFETQGLIVEIVRKAWGV